MQGLGITRASNPPVTFVTRLSLGKLSVNLLHVVKRTNAPLIPEQMASSTDHGFFGSWVRSPPSTIIINFSDFRHVELEKYSPWYPRE